MFCSIVTKNSNWQTLTKKDEKLTFLGFTEKSEFYGEGFTKNQYIGELPKKGGLDSLQI